MFIRYFYTTGIFTISIIGAILASDTKGQKIGKEKNMTAIIRLFNLNNEHSKAQLNIKELGVSFAYSFKGRSERMDCVDEPG